jgi:hypothetical protein
LTRQAAGQAFRRFYFKKGLYNMAAEYSNTPLQTVAEDANVLFGNGERSCKKGYIDHSNGAGIFTVRGVPGYKAIYRVQFQANIAVAPAADGGVLGPISVALTENGEALGNATAIVTPAAIGDFFAVSISTFIALPCGCCKTFAVRNVSDGTAISVQNANIIIERVA